MVQRNYRAEDLKELKWNLVEIFGSDEYQRAKTVLVNVLVECWNEQIIRRIISMIRAKLPNALIFGLTTTNREMASLEDMGPGMDELYSVVLDVWMFASATVQIETYEITDDFCEIASGGKLGVFLSGEKDVKGVHLASAGLDVSVDDFLAMAAAENPDIPFFGERSCIAHNDEVTDPIREGCIFTRDRVIKKGYIAAVFKGKDLHIRTGYNFGWSPVGKKMTITKMEENNIVAEIDNRPAARVYGRYLGLEEGQITMDNVCEFPFAIRRGDRLMARASYGIGDGKLQFNTPVFEGDEIRLAYGNPDIIYAEVFADAAEVRRFQPQALMLIACMNRTLLLKEDVEIERSFYSPAVPEKALYHGHSEILYDSEGGGDLNSSLVSVAFREGEPTGATPAIEPCHRDETCPYQAKRIPLVLRMTSFLNAITGDLESEVEKAREANEAKTRFLSSVSHEIRTPINAVLGLDEMILRESSEADIRKYAIDIQNSGRTLLSLINDLLDSSRIDSGKMELIPVEYELSSLLNDLVNMTAVRAEEKNLKLAVNVDFNIPHILYGDDTRIKQCVLNILTNAVKYTETGSVEMTVGFRRLDEENIGLSFAVKDTGIGIREEDIPKLYRPFERIEEARNRGIEGTGLGMNIVLSLLKLMGSELKVESVYGEGSTFSFEITQKVVKDEPIGDFSEMYRQSVETTVNYHESFRAPEARLLVVDDTRMNLTVIRGLLKATQVKIDTAESGKEALSLVSKYHYDIIFLDQRMPQMDGIETLRRMKHSYENINQGVPVIMLTANAMSGAREMFLEEGFDDYLTKPINGKKLEKTIRELLPPEKLLPPSEEDPKAAGSESEGAADGDPYASSPFLSALNRIPGLSVKEGLENCMDEDILRATIRDYAQAAGNTIERIKSFINDHDIENYTITVHALKSSSRIIGAGGLSEQAKYLEACGDEGNTGEIHEKTPALLQLYGHLAEQLLAALEGRLGEAGAPGPSEASASGPSEAGWEVRSLEESEIIEIPPIEEDDAAEQQEPSQAEPQEEDLPALPEDQLDAALAGVRELVEAFDFDGAADILNMLSGYSLTEQVKARTASLSGHIARLERDEILKEL